MPIDSVRLEDLSWTDVAERLAAGWRTVIVMTASMEQHGPHLPTMTDTAIGYAVGDRVARLLGRTFLAPVIRPGCSDHHLAFPGSLSIPVPVFIDTVAACVRSLAPQGFSRFVLLSAHGGNFGRWPPPPSGCARSMPAPGRRSWRMPVRRRCTRRCG